MANLNYTAEEINALLAKADTAVQPALTGNLSDLETTAKTNLVAAINEVNGEIGGIADDVGDLSDLETTVKTDLVAAVNELFTSASDGKSEIAAAITGKGISTAASDSYATMADNIGELQPSNYVDPSGYVKKLVTNDGNITPSGTYATSTYYNTTYGVKIGYMANGDIILSMRAGTSTNYEYLNFVLGSAPSGVTLTWALDTSSNYATGKPGMQYACVLSGITGPVTIAVAMNSQDATYDYVTCTINITAVSA